MKKILSILMVLAMFLAMVPTGAVAVSAATSGTTGDCTWRLDGTHLTISGNGAMGNYESSFHTPWGNNITSVTIESGVTTIAQYAFEFCDSLTSVTIGNSVTTIAQYAFASCTSLTSITIPDSVTTIAIGVFNDCTSLTNITVSISNPSYCDVDGVLFSKDQCTLVAYPAGKSGPYSIPNSVTIIGVCAFQRCKSLTSVTIGNSVTTIGNAAFNDCPSLTSVTIGDSVTTIGNNAFLACGSLESVIIPDSVTTIGACAFNGCKSLTSVTIGDSVTTIGERAFAFCTSLTDVYYHGTPEDHAAISIDSKNTQLTEARWHYFDNVCDTDCNVCGGIREVPNHVYTDNCDIDCNECNAKRKPPHDYDDMHDDTCNTCGAWREISAPIVCRGNSISEDVNGLAFLFTVNAEIDIIDGFVTQIDYSNSTFGGFAVIQMGCKMSNGFEEIDIPVKYVWNYTDSTVSYAVRIVGLTEDYMKACTITGKPYVVYEQDGVEVTLYGDIQSASYNSVLNG